MNSKIKQVIYKKTSSHGQGAIPLGTKGTVLMYVDNPTTVKLLVNFEPYGKAIIPLSSVDIIEE